MVDEPRVSVSMPLSSVNGLPTLTYFQLANALSSSLVACGVASAQFLPWFGDRFSNQLFALSTAWALSYTSLDYSFSVDFAWKTYIGAAIGAALGAVVAYATAPLNGDIYSPAWSCLFGLPFCFILAMGCQGKASEVYSYTSALLRMYSILAFGEGEPYNKALFIILVGFFSDMVPMLIVSVLNCSNLLPVKCSPPLPRFERALKGYLELSVFHLADAVDHQNEFNRKRNDLVEAHRAVVRGNVSKPLKLDVANIVGLLYGFHACTTAEGFGAQARAHFWEPLRRDMWELVSRVGRALTESFDPDLVESLRTLGGRVTQQIKSLTVEYSRNVADAKCAVFSGKELARIEMALLTVPRCSIIVADYVEKRRKEDSTRDPITCQLPLPSFVRDFQDWLRKPWYPPTLSWWERIRYPLRLTICLQAVVWLAVGLATRFEVLAAEGWWIIVPAILCSFDAFGLTVIKGARRIFGIFLGGVLALVPVAIHPVNRPAFLLELFIVGSITKLVTDFPSVDYTGLQTGVTFIIVGFADGINPGLREDERFQLAGLRLLCNTGGLVLFVLMTLLTRPPYSGHLLAKTTSRELGSMADYVSSVVRALRAGPEVAFPDRVEKGLSLLDADAARIAKIPSVETEARALKVLRITTTGCGVKPKRLAAAQTHMSSLLHSIAVVFTEFHNCDRKMGPAARQLLLEPISGLLEDFEESLKASAEELSVVLTRKVSASRAIRAARDVLEAYLRLAAAFETVRAELLFRRTWATSGEVMASTKLAEVVSGGGGVGVHVAVYTLGHFIEDWITVANSLLGSDIRPPNDPPSEKDWTTSVDSVSPGSCILTVPRCVSEGSLLRRK